MVNYLNRYSVCSAHIYALLSALTHQTIDYKPKKEHYENFNQLKMEVSTMGALPYFDVNAEKNPPDGNFQERTWSMHNLEGKGGLLCFQSFDQT